LDIEIEQTRGRVVVVKRYLLARLIRWILKKLRATQALDGAGHGLFCNSRSYIGTEIFIDGYYEARYLSHLKILLKRFSKGLNRPLSLALDVGANIGNHCAALGPEFNQIIAVEPHPFTFNVLRLNLEWHRRSNVRAINLGLGAREELSLLTDFDDLGGNRVIGGTNGPERTLQVQIRPGDALIEELAPDEDVDFVKIDVESHEIQVLQGLQRTIERHRPIIALEYRQSDNQISLSSQLPGYQLFEFGHVSWGRASRFKVAEYASFGLTGSRKFGLIELNHLSKTFYEMIICIPREKVFLFSPSSTPVGAVVNRVIVKSGVRQVK